MHEADAMCLHCLLPFFYSFVLIMYRNVEIHILESFYLVLCKVTAPMPRIGIKGLTHGRRTRTIHQFADYQITGVSYHSTLLK